MTGSAGKVIGVLKEIARYTLLVTGGLLALPLAMLAIAEETLFRTDHFFHLGATTVALIPGWPGNFVRGAYYCMTLRSFHPTATIAFGSYFADRDATVAAGAGIGAYCVIGLADIGSKARIAGRVSIISGLQDHGDNHDHPRQTVGERNRVRIGTGAWLGEHATVATEVGDNAVVAAGAVVMSPVPSETVAMGNPARILPLAQPSACSSHHENSEPPAPQPESESSTQTAKSSRPTGSGMANDSKK